MHVAHIRTLSKAHPPHIDHGVVITALVFEIVEHTCHVAVAVVAAYVVHAFAVCLVRSLYALVVEILLLLGHLQNHVLVAFTKRKIIH